MLTYLAIAHKHQPKWLVWENVPGVLSSNGGNDFASLLRGMGELGYGFAYRILDAQYFGVAQRRRRVFVIGCLGDWRSAAAVLFERHSLSGHPAPSRKKGQEVAGTIAARFGNSRNNHEECVAQTLQARAGQGGFDLETETPIIMSTLCASDATKWGSNQWVDEGKAVLHPIALAENTIGRQPQNGGNGNGFTVGGPMYTLNATGVHGVAQPIGFEANMSLHQPSVGGVYQTLTRSTYASVLIPPSMAVRRLTPIECERLQGFPDNYTNIPWRNKPESPDGPRYKSLGNSMAVPVMKWIGERINQMEAI
jgi:DNA (cytosine-5)-methyltransferase 1